MPVKCQEKTCSKYMPQLLASQRDEITSYVLYNSVAKKLKNKHNREILTQIARNELEHYIFLKQYSGQDVRPLKAKLLFFKVLAKILGLTFAFKYFEYGEGKAINGYKEMMSELPELKAFIDDEEAHEQAMIDIIQERKLNYVGSIVLGLNDALVEFTGALAGYTFAMRDSRLIGVIGLITGVAAALSMASSEYFSKKNEIHGEAKVGENMENVENPLAASIYTGMAYIVTVVLLVLPFFLLGNYFVALIISVLVAILVIFMFNFYISIVKNYKFWPRFLTMAGISLSVAAISFVIGIIIRMVFNVEV